MGSIGEFSILPRSHDGVLPGSALPEDFAVICNDERSLPWANPRATQSESVNIRKPRKRDSAVFRKCKRISTVGRLYHDSIIPTRCLDSSGAIEGHGKSGGTKLR